MHLLVSAALVSALNQTSEAPTEIVYLPEGENSITATVNGAPKTIAVRVPRERGSEIAARLQTALTKRHGENVRPWFSFEHKPGAASALPKAFRYEPGRGVMCSVEWTASGKSAVEGKDFSYFSPTFLLGDDGLPNGLPAKGEFGALVNEPAFREIPRIAAADAGSLEDLEAVFAADPEAYNAYLRSLGEPSAPVGVPSHVPVSASAANGTKVSATAQLEEIARDRVACGYAQTFDDGLTQAVDANPDLYRQSMTEGVKALNQMPNEIQAALAVLEPGERADVERLASRIYLVEGASTEADSLMLAIQRTPGIHAKCASAQPVRSDTMEQIKEMRTRLEESTNGPHRKLKAIASGYFSLGLAGNEDEAWLKAIEDNPQLFQEWQDQMPKPTAVKAAGATGFEGKARALVTAGQARTLDEAFELVAASDPTAYSEYLKTLH